MEKIGAFRSLLHLGESGPRWPMAVRAALAIAIPVAVAALAGSPSLGLQASIGAFTVLYVAGSPVIERMRILPFVGAAIVLCAAAGALAAGSIALTTIGLMVVAAAASILVYGYATGPPGPIFFPLVFGAAAHITAPVDGVRMVDPVLFVVLVAAGAAFAYLLGIAPIVRRRARAEPSRTLRQRFPKLDLVGEPTRTLIVRSLTVAILGSGVALLFETERAYWVVCAALAILSGGSGRHLTLTRGLHRVVGTVAGAALYLAIAGLTPSGLWLAGVLGLLQFAVEILVVRNYALALLFITPLVLTITGSAAGTAADPMSYALERLVDTIIGAALAAVAALVWRERP